MNTLLEKAERLCKCTSGEVMPEDANPNLDKTSAENYGNLKQELAKKYTFERKLYTAGKKDLIEQLLNEAMEWRI